MEFEHFTLTVTDDIAVFTVNRPQVRNAMNEACWKELSAFLDWVDQTPTLKGIIITGAGEKAFVAGADINFLKERTMVSALEVLAQRTLRKLAACKLPVIAAVNGYAFGGGCELAMACDIRISSEKAAYALPELGLGILPAGGGTQRLAKLVGVGRAKEMILTGRIVKAEEALAMGLTTKVVAPEELMDAAFETARCIAQKGPFAVRLAKQAVNAALSTDEDTGMMIETLSYGLVIASDDRMEGVTAFLEKRSPEFSGH
ncbi:enoyl-CoA hydratase-related protein [Flavonifractor sp. An4]|uniref:enoyl-CoA hydratase-related protein n=1 Tax=Flavonifractor sp. An4 TaxID=1965634 RepID=UPI000B39649C|nr:enoyl-CoA hydratase-related protein [Flavonifractor sp. An4]OUO13643.1 hypothetical protein B5F94_09950 [Flavonifractor sp. An4]